VDAEKLKYYLKPQTLIGAYHLGDETQIDLPLYNILHTIIATEDQQFILIQVNLQNSSQKS